MYATASGTNNASCQNCETTTTPLWRRAEDGTNLCNACGLFLRLHGRPRPITLKSNVIRSRNRIRAPLVNKHRKTPYDAPATPGEIARQQQHQQQMQQHQQVHQHQTPHHLSPYEPHPRSLMTPNAHDESHAQFTENVFDPQLSNPANQVPNATNPFDVGQSQYMDGGNDANGNKSGAEQDQDGVANQLSRRVVELELQYDLLRRQYLDLGETLDKYLGDFLQIPAEDASPDDLKRRVLDLQREVKTQLQQEQQQQEQPQGQQQQQQQQQQSPSEARQDDQDTEPEQS